MLPPKFIFCHIPKVAGTLFGQILQRNFSKRFYPYYGLWDNRFFTKEDVAGMCDLHPQYECLASHMFSLDLPFDSERFDFRAICFVRDPVERALSLYFYSFRMAQLNPGYKPPESMEVFFRALFDGQESRRFSDGQYRFLCGARPGSLSVESIQSLAESGKLLIAPVHRFDDACMALEIQHRTFFRNTAYGQRKNVAARREEVPASIRQLLLDHNEKDSQLYQMVDYHFDSWFSSVIKTTSRFSDHQKNYQRRCRKQLLRDKVRQFFGR